MDHSTFLRVIIASPADDGPRLVFADWLEEQGESDRAEFIRIQIELNILSKDIGRIRHHVSQVVKRRDAGMEFDDANDNCDCGQCTHPRALKRRERALLDLRNPLADNEHLADSWFSDASFRMVTHGSAGPCWWYAIFPPYGASAFTTTLRRGFVNEIHLNLGEFAGGRCERCSGRGQYWPVGRSAGGPAPGPYEPCYVCNATGRVPGIAARLAKSQPVTKIVLTDRRPYHTVGQKWGWNNEFAPGGDGTSLPDFLWDRLEPSGGRRSYPTEAAAQSALSAACVAYARRMATP